MTNQHLILLLRHADAEAARADRQDAERRLTPRGERAARGVAAAMRVLGLPVDAILTSPLLRARETAAIVADGYAIADRVEVTPALAPGAGPDGVIAALGACRAAAGVLLVGHQPDLSEIASTLLAGTPQLVPLPFAKAALAGISVVTLPPRELGVIEFFLTPGQLLRIAG